MNEAYSQIAWDQLDALEQADPQCYADVLDLVEGILNDPGRARGTADVLMTSSGTRFKNFIDDRYPLAVVWSEDPADGPRIEAIFPHPARHR